MHDFALRVLSTGSDAVAVEAILASDNTHPVSTWDVIWGASNGVEKSREQACRSSFLKFWESQTRVAPVICTLLDHKDLFVKPNSDCSSAANDA